MKARSDFWHVKFPDGATRRLSLDELDAAFNDGAIDENTPVLSSSGFSWTTLGEVAGLDAAPPASAFEPNSIAPMAMSAHAPPSVPVDLFDDASDGLPQPRAGRNVIRAVIAVAALAVLGLVGFVARPALQHALASSSSSDNETVEAQLRAEARAKADADAKAILDATAKATADAKAAAEAKTKADADKAKADADKAKADADAKAAKKGKRVTKRK